MGVSELGLTLEGYLMSGTLSGFWWEDPWVLFFVLAFGTYVSEDLTCVLAGVLAAAGKINPFFAVSACYAGIFSGDMLLYLAGRLIGKPLLKIKFLARRMDAGRLEESKKWMERKGLWILFLSRFVPGSRLPTYFYSGLVKMNPWRFGAFLGLTCLVWTPLIVIPSIFFGKIMLEWIRIYSSNALWIALCAFALFYTAVRVLPGLLTWKGRRLFLMKLKRMRHYEFWNTHVFYFPVYLYILFLGLWHRGLTLFTISNPFIYGSGIKGESKKEIMRHWVGSSCAGRFFFLDGSPDLERQVGLVRDFMKENNLNFPLAFKPNVGERGIGFFRAKDEADLRAKLEGKSVDYVVQENFEGEEFGVLYIRKPDETKGRIFSLSRKAMIWIEGDGKSDLEHLILSHPRALLMAKFHLKKHADKLDWVLPKGEKFQLVDLGTHSMGSIFLDANQLITPELENAVDEISQLIPNFHVGRYDLRVPNTEDLKAGKNLKIMELNLVTGEPAHIYDPANSIFKAYATLFRLWKIIFRIGSLNRKQGFAPLSFAQLMKIIY